MSSELIASAPPSHPSHATIVCLHEASRAYCGVTTHRDGERMHCAITRRVGSHPQAEFSEAVRYIRETLLPRRSPESIVWIEDEFEMTAARKLLHAFSAIEIDAFGKIIKRASFELEEHARWTLRVQPAVRLLLELGV